VMSSHGQQSLARSPEEILHELRQHLCAICCLRVDRKDIPEVTRIAEEHGEETQWCWLCCGILQPGGPLGQITKHVSESLRERAYTPFSTWQVHLQVPIGCVLHDLIWAIVERAAGKSSQGIADLKEVAKSVVTSALTHVLPPVDSSTPAPSMKIGVVLTHKETEVGLLEHFTEVKSKRGGRAAWRQRHGKTITQADADDLKDTTVSSLPTVPALTRLLQHMSIEKLVGHVGDKNWWANVVPSKKCAVATTVVEREPLFLRGRYRKLSRECSQTPWTLRGTDERRTDGSVEEFIKAPVIEIFGVRGECRFSSAGREDVDVRMLGSGRPFLLELVDCLHGSITAASGFGDLPKLVKSRSGGIVEVQDLEICDRTASEKLVEGAEKHQKHYLCVIWVKKSVTKEDIANLNAVRELSIHQRTPVRVLHRRTNMIRQRMVHKLAAEPLNAHFIILHVWSAAGTYIKEFVHGDLGRTVPSIRSILDSETDILQLDVADLVDEPVVQPCAKKLRSDSHL